MLTELEGAVLSVIARRQPLSAYRIRKEFEAAATHSWSASAGAVYPLVKRLTKDGLLREDARPEDRRGTILLSLTAAGADEMKRWVEDSDPTSLAANADPMRTRAFALGNLTREQRLELLRRWRSLSEQGLEQTKLQMRRCEKDADTMGALATRGAQLQLEARITWIDELIEAEAPAPARQ